MSISSPQNVLAVHIGSGAVLLQFDSAVNVNHYEVWVSNSLTGVYNLYNGDKHYSNNIILYNVPVGNNDVYIKVIAVDSSGSKSLSTQAHRGMCNKTTNTFLVRAIRGSVIPANSIFSLEDNSRLIGIKAVSKINVL